jgi:hypothetical protein
MLDGALIVRVRTKRPAEAGANSRLGRVLDEWRRRSAAYSSLDVKFTGRARNATWGRTNL